MRRDIKWVSPFRAPRLVEQRDVTVCVATLFQWNYRPVGEPTSFGRAAILMTDRKITIGDIEYEPPQAKIAKVSDRALIAVAGDYSLHSEAIARTEAQLKRRPDTAPYALALIYGQAIQEIKRKQAEDMVLAPIGLNLDIFHDQIREYPDAYSEGIKRQMQEYHGADVEALIVASDGAHAHILHVDRRGTVSNMNDLGFAAIGSGSWHAQSRLMQSKYVNYFYYPKALTEIFAAKRASEVAPGVGSKETDSFLVLSDHIEVILPDTYKKLDEIYRGKVDKFAKIEDEAVEELRLFMLELGVPPSGETKAGST
jgi:20S proteasome alpha/beta subunit